MSIAQLIPIIIALPLIGAFLNGIIGKRLPKKSVAIIATSVMVLSFALALITFFKVQHLPQGEIVRLFTMLRTSNFEINASFLADNLSLWMTLIVTGIGTLIHVFSIGYMKHDEGFYKFFVYLNLFIFAMLDLVLSNNYFVLFFGWEGVGMCSYLLIGFWYGNFRNALAARKAFIMNRIGDLGLLVGLFLMLTQFGTLEYGQVATMILVDEMELSQKMALGITACLFIGAIGKSAQIPLFTWFPDAMAGPTPVSALIHAATMVTAGIFLVIFGNTQIMAIVKPTKPNMMYNSVPCIKVLTYPFTPSSDTCKDLCENIFTCAQKITIASPFTNPIITECGIKRTNFPIFKTPAKI